MPTVRRCCIVGCLSNSRQNPHLQFFQFPRPENPFHKLWKQACHASLSRILPFKKPVMCALHFQPNCIGGRRLVANAVPTLRLDVPHDLKAVEQKAMMEEIERSRKFAYINAVVYEWLVRANLNPHLRGSITHGMIKEKAEAAKQLIGCEPFEADNRWLNRFRETHLVGFAQKLAANQLKPLGPSLWIPDIVQDMEHLFPPTTAERMANIENLPEQYINYMQQYDEYDEDDDSKPEKHDENAYQPHEQTYQEQQQQTLYMQQQYQQSHGAGAAGGGGVSPVAFMGGHPHQSFPGYGDFYGERGFSVAQQQHHHLHQNLYNIPQVGQRGPADNRPEREMKSMGQHQERRPPRLQSLSLKRSSSLSPVEGQFVPGVKRRSAHDDPPSKTLKITNGDDGGGRVCSPAASPDHFTNGINDDANDRVNVVNNNNNTNGNKANGESRIMNGKKTPSSSPRPSPAATPNTMAATLPSNPLRTMTNGRMSLSPPYESITAATASSGQRPNKQLHVMTNGKRSPKITNELKSYKEALDYLKPLEDFALFRENFRAIGLISQLESVLQKHAIRRKEITE